MRRRYVTVDVFTERAFGGNPLAVVLDADGLSASQMQALAIELNYSETTFVLPPKHRDHSAWVRIFTPSSEIPFAGHPNVGTAFALAKLMVERKEEIPEQLIFEEEAGLVPVALLQQDGEVIGAELLAPEPFSRRAQVAQEKAAACLSLSADDIRTDRHQPQVVSVGLPFLVVELASRDALRRAAPNREAFAEVLPLDGARSVYAYTRERGAAPAEANSDILGARVQPSDDGGPGDGKRHSGGVGAARRAVGPARWRTEPAVYAGGRHGTTGPARGADPHEGGKGDRCACRRTLRQRHGRSLLLAEAN